MTMLVENYSGDADIIANALSHIIKFSFEKESFYTGKKLEISDMNNLLAYYIDFSFLKNF